MTGNIVPSENKNPFLNKTKIAELVFTDDSWATSSAYSGFLEQARQMTAEERANANASNILMFTLLRYYYGGGDSRAYQTTETSQHIIDLNQLVSEASAHSTAMIRLNLQLNPILSPTSKIFSVIDIRGWNGEDQYSWTFNLYIDSSVSTRDYKIIVEKLA